MEYAETVEGEEVHAKVNPKFWSFFENKARYSVLYGGAGAGKSVAAAQKWMWRALHEPGVKLLVARKVRATMRESVFALLRQLVADWHLQDVVQVRVARLALEFANGSEIVCVGLDDADKLKSIAGICGVWVEEATDIAAKDFAQLELRVRGKTVGHKQFVLTFNPVDVGHWLHKRFFEELKIKNEKLRIGGEGDVLVVHATAQDNGAIDVAYLDHLAALREDENLFRVYSLGQWGHLLRGGEFYKGFAMGRHVGTATYRADLPLHFSFDFNLHPYITCTVWQVEGQALRQIDELCLAHPRNSTHALGQALVARYGRHTAGVRLYGDPGGFQIGLHGGGEGGRRFSHYAMLAEALRAVNPEIRAVKNARPVAERGIFINALLEGRVEELTIVIDSRCTKTVEDYQFTQEEPDGTKRKAMYTDAASGVRCQRYGHCTDANDYFFCEVLYQPYSRFFTTIPKPMAVLGIEHGYVGVYR